MSDARQYDNNRKENLNFKDSWLNNTVELAALGTIVAGAGTLAVKGNLGSSLKSGKRAFQAFGKGFENYLKRNNRLGHFGYNLGKKTFKNLKKMPLPDPEEGRKMLLSKVRDIVDEVETNPDIQKRIQTLANRQFNDEVGMNKQYLATKGQPLYSHQDPDLRRRELYEHFKNEEVKKLSGIAPPSSPQKPKDKWFQSSDGKPLLDKKEVSKEMITSGLVGLGFAGGITGMHAIDRLSGNPDTQKNVEDAFHYAGSFLPRKDEGKMKKEAGSLETYNALKQIGRKTPEAVATGLGFTGVSLGTAKVLNKSKEQTKEEDSNKTRVIIELGAQEPHNDKLNTAFPAGNLLGLPKLSSSESTGLAKVAFRGFIQDFKGYDPVIKKLRAKNYDEIAAHQLKDDNIPAILKREYGNLINDKTEAQFTKHLFDNRAKGLKEWDDKHIKNLETLTANARLKAGAGALTVGGGLAALGATRKGDQTNG